MYDIGFRNRDHTAWTSSCPLTSEDIEAARVDGWWRGLVVGLALALGGGLIGAVVVWCWL